MANINRDYLIVLDAKSSVISDADELKYYITDEHSQNLFVNLVVRDIERINKYVEVHDPQKYELELHIVKPNNDIVRPHLQANLLSAQDAIYAFELPKEATDYIGTYKCELRVTYQETDETTITTSNKFKYKVKRSIYNDLDSIQDAPQYPVVIQLFDKLSDINQYEEDRRANELARQVAEQQRQTRFDALDAAMVDGIQGMDDKVVEVENRITTKEQAVDKLIVDTKADINNYKVAKDQEIDDYKTAKDTEINTAIANQNKQITDAVNAQDSKIDTAIKAQNDKISVVENNDIVQNNRLDVLENRATTHESRLTVVEAKNQQQDDRLDVVENKNTQQDSRLDVVEAKNVEQDNRLNNIEAIDVAQNTRLDAIEIKNQQQDDRLLNIEKVNKKQDIDINCLFNLHSVDIEEEGNSVYLQNSTDGRVIIDNIQGQTLVNCNKEPDKEIILNGNINTQGYGNITLTEGVDGGLVDVALEGNTMVNVCDQKDPVALPFEKELAYLYTSTQYAVQFVSDAVSKVDITLGGAKLLNQDVVVGTNKYTITTPSELIDNNLVLNGEGFNASNIVVTEATDQDFGYFEGMKSVGECEDLEVVSGNKNLWDYNKIKPTSSQYLELIYSNKNNVTISLTDKDTSVDIRGCLFGYGKNSQFANWIPLKDGSIITNANMIRIYPNKQETIDKLNARFNIQIEESTVATDYIPHAHNTQTLTHEPLRAVGDVKDKYVLIDGKWYIERNCGEVVLDGSEGWYLQSGEHYQLTLAINRLYLKQSGIGKCNIMKVANSGDDVYVFPILQENVDYIRIQNGVTRWNSVDLFKQWLTNNNLIITYPLETPTYEPINYNPLEVYSGITHISNNSTIPCNMVIKNTGYNCLLKPNTTYTVSSNLGLNTVTTPSTLTEDCLRFYDTDTSTVTTMKNVMVLEGDYTTGKPIPSHFSGIESAFEQEYDEEKGKYKVKIRVQNEDASKENYIEFYISEPLRGIGDVKDRVYVKNDKVVVERNCGQREYQDGDFGTYLTDKVNTVYQLAQPTYEEVEYNDVKLFIESFKNSTLFYDSNIPVTSKVHYSYSVPIVDTVAQTANISDQQDSMIIDLATQVAVMEMMLM